jgi:hypothetical protein
MSRPPMAFAVLAALIVLILTLGVTACGTADRPPGGGGSSSTVPPDSTSSSDTTSSTVPASTSTTLPAGSIAHPTGAADVVIRFSTGGGFVPIEYNYTMVPEFTLFGDGRIIETGPVTMQYPGMALPNLQTAVVSEEVIQTMLAAAKEAGLFQNGVDYGQPGVTDVGTTTITVNADGVSYVSGIYALGFEDGGNLTMQQQQARAAISSLQGKLTDPSTLTGEQPAWESYDFTAIRVYSRAVDTTASTDPTDIKPGHLPWPFADLATSGAAVANGQGLRMVVVSGDDLATLKPLLTKATQITLWDSGDAKYNVWLRPLLPDEAAAS